MTLKEKIRPHVKYWDCYNDEPIKYDHENKLAKIADNYAVEFAKWCRRNQHSYDLSPYSYKELLEIFKKEKGL